MDSGLFTIFGVSRLGDAIRDASRRVEAEKMNTLDVVFTTLLYALPITMMAALVLLTWMNARLGNLVRLARKYSNEVKES
jgi:hypothetical protein